MRAHSVTVGISEAGKPYLLSFGSWGALCRCSGGAQYFSLLATFLDRPVDVVSNPGPQWFVDYELIQRRNLLLTIGTDKVVL